MDEYEFPKEIPIATRWAGSAWALIFRGGTGGLFGRWGCFRGGRACKESGSGQSAQVWRLRRVGRAKMVS
jgi:hypothetical protein